MLKSAIKISAALLLLTACNDVVMEPGRMGSIALSLSSDLEVQTPTKADSYDCSGFNVTVSGLTEKGDDYLKVYEEYSQMNQTEPIPYGTYSISAQNCDAAQAAEGYGCARYSGTSSQFGISSQTPVAVTVNCVMVNAKATLTLDSSFLEDFDVVSMSLKVDREVQLLTQEFPAGGQPVYFNVPEEGGNLIYTVKARLKGQEGEPLAYTNASSAMLLEPAKWAKIIIKSNHNGTILGPDISVDDEMDENSSTQIVDPDSGTEVIKGDLNLPIITVNTKMDDATVIDCVLDID